MTPSVINPNAKKTSTSIRLKINALLVVPIKWAIQQQTTLLASIENVLLMKGLLWNLSARDALSKKSRTPSLNTNV